MIDALAQALAAHGLAVTGAFHPEPGDGAPEGTGTLCLIGAAGGAMWEAFAASPELHDGAPHPLDRWSRRVIEGVAADLGAQAVFPFGGPPYAPFLGWGKKAEAARPSPVGMLVSAGRGLWISWRGAIGLPDACAVPSLMADDPCIGCPAPCLTACPVGAMGAGKPYDVAACTRHVRSPQGAACHDGGCKVRHACPAGRRATPAAAQCAFHMAAFLAAHPPKPAIDREPEGGVHSIR